MRKSIIALATSALAACAASSPDVVGRYETERVSHVRDAWVLAVRPVTIEGSQTGVGSTAGAVAGAAAGSNVGGYHDSFLGLILGAVLGAVIGDVAERGVTREGGVELLVQLRNGERRAIVQATGRERFAAGDAVILVTANGRTRVSRAPTPTPTPAAVPAPAAAQPVPAYPAPVPLIPRS